MRLFNYLLLLVLIFCLYSCSLLKFSVESGIEPLPKQELNTRMAVHSFYQDFVKGMVLVSDSILQTTSNDTLKTNVLRLKIAATEICTSTAYQTVPKSSLMDTWVFCEQLDEYFASEQAKGLFGDYLPLYNYEMENQKNQIEKIAKSLYSGSQYKSLKSFVEEYAESHPQKSMDFSLVNTRPDLLTYLQIPDTSYVETVGSTPEVFNDLTDRISVYNTQLKNQISWQKEIWAIQWKGDTLATQFLSKADSISVLLKDLAIIAQESPEMMGIIAVRMREELSPLVADMSGGMKDAAMQLSRDREQLQQFIAEQRVVLVEDLNTTGSAFIKDTSEGIALIIQKSAFAIILLLIVMVVIIFGLPFTLGFYLAKAKFGKKKD